MAGWSIAVLLAALLIAAARAEEDGASSRWRVLGPDGQGLARVALLPRAGGSAADAGIDVFDESTSARVVPTPGGWLVLPHPAGAKGWIVTGEGLGAVVVEPTESIGGVRLLRAAPLTGVLRFQGERPAAELPVVAFPYGRSGLAHRTRTDASGRYRFAHLTAGPWELAVVRGDGRRQTMGIFQAGSTTEAAHHALLPGSLVRGQVRDADANDRRGVEGLSIRLVALPRTSRGERDGVAVITGQDGAFTLADVPGGVYEAALVGENALDYYFDPSSPRLEVPVQGMVTERAWYVRPTRIVEGRIEGAGKGIAGAEVRVLADRTLADSRTLPREIPPVTSKDDGSFRVTGVSIGRGYRLWVTAPGFAPYVGDPFDVAEPEPKLLDPVYLSTGWILEVHARAPGGAPIAGAEIRVLPAARPVEGTDGDPATALRTARTGADGRAFLSDLPSDDVRVAVEAEGCLVVEGTVEEPRTGNARLYTATLFPAPVLRGRVVFAAEDVPERVEVRGVPWDASSPRSADPDAEGHFVLRDLPALPTDVEVRRRDGLVIGRVDGVVPGATEDLIIALPPRVAISGQVQDIDAGGGPAEVLLEAPSFAPEEGEHRWIVVSSASLPSTGGRAPFAFAGLAPGMYSVRARQGSNDSDATTVFAESSVDGLLLTLPESGRVAGTVFDEEGRVLLGIETRLVRVRGEGESPRLPGGPLRTVTDRKGAYVFPGVAPGVWRVEVRPEALAGEAETIRVAEGENLVVRDLVVRAGGTLEGTITDGSTRTLDGARLELEPLAEGVGRRTAYSGRAGHFRVAGLAQGFWRLRVRAAAGAHRDLEVLVEVVAHEITEVELAAGGEGRVEGTVQREGKAVADAAVYLLRRASRMGEIARRLVTHTDGTGTFVWDGLEPGLYEVDLVDGGVRAMSPISVYEGDVVRLELEAWGGRIPGEVRMASGFAVAGASVIARPPNTEGWKGFEASVRTDPQGRFLFTGLPPGRYDLDVSAPGLPPGWYQGAVAEVFGAERPVSITIGRGGLLDLLVTDDRERGIGATRIWIEAEDGTPIHTRPYVTVPSGRLRVEGIPEGVWWLRVHAVRYGRLPRIRTVVREGKTTTLDVPLAPASQILLEVNTRSLDPTTRARVDVLRLPGREPVERRRTLGRVRLDPLWGRLPRTGRLVVTDLSAGRYLIVVDAGPAFEKAEVAVDVIAGKDAEARIDLIRR